MKLPVLAVLPYIHDLHLEAEDAIDHHQPQRSQSQLLKVAVIGYPRMSNHTDFDVLRLHPQVDCEFVRQPEQFNGADVIVCPAVKTYAMIWPGSRSAVGRWYYSAMRLGGKLLGICGGYQMLGLQVQDPLGVESAPGVSEGLGFLPLQTRLGESKLLRNRQGHCVLDARAGVDMKGAKVSSYEIHSGRTSVTQPLAPVLSWPPVMLINVINVALVSGSRKAPSVTMGR